ncbi:MAG: biopolymer transporter ExbD [Bdellovibrionaceae bacterium]|nr:biopolymer transporter ExbD [Pseudobdellovibrionaceae bacterium]
MENELSKNKILTSELKKCGVLNAEGKVTGTGITPSLVLTPLVDAFAILVIYLLVNTSAAQHQILIDGTINLPIASKTQSIDEGILVKVEKDEYIVENKKVSSSQLVYELRKLMAKQNPDKIPFLIVEADKSSSFESLSPIMVAGSSAGFEKFKFAVIQGGVQ